MAATGLFGQLDLKTGKDGTPAQYLLNGVPFVGVTGIERLYDGETAVSPQQPSALDTTLELQFGPAEGTASDPIQTLVRGGNPEASILQINTSGLYRIKTAIQFGRTGGAGTSILNFRALINGTQAGRSINAQIENSNVVQLLVDEAWLDLTAGMQITYELIRDSGGNNSGGAFAGTTSGSTGYNAAPAVALRVERWE